MRDSRYASRFLDSIHLYIDSISILELILILNASAIIVNFYRPAHKSELY